jgi:hypothetical protein
MKRLILFVLFACSIGCTRVGSTAGVAPAAPAPVEAADGHPSKAEVLDYLDGKPMPLALSGPEAKADNTVTLQKGEIDALEVEQAGTSVDGGPWVTKITFLVNSATGKYAVRAEVKHRRVENKRAFFGLEFREIAKQ